MMLLMGFFGYRFRLDVLSTSVADGRGQISELLINHLKPRRSIKWEMKMTTTSAESCDEIWKNFRMDCSPTGSLVIAHTVIQGKSCFFNQRN